MKKLDQFIIKSFLGPFIGILLVVIFILMLQFLWLYIDELVGKGLGLKIIMEFLGWGAATMLPLSLPLATLLSSVMTVGQMAENNELIAMKSAGISLTRVLSPIIICAAVISVLAFFAANNLVPVAYNKIFTLRDDIGKTKAEISIPTGTFYDGIDGYVLRIDSKDDKTGIMHGVLVYDHTAGKGNVSRFCGDKDVQVEGLSDIPDVQRRQLSGNQQYELPGHIAPAAKSEFQAAGHDYPIEQLCVPEV